jgi:hypothetical protein
MDEKELRQHIAHEIDLYFNGRTRWSLTDLLKIVRGDAQLSNYQIRNMRSSKVYLETRKANG